MKHSTSMLAQIRMLAAAGLLHTREEADPNELLLKQFGEYHGEVKGMAESVKDVMKRLETLETRMARPGVILPTGKGHGQAQGHPAEVEMRQAFAAYARTGELDTRSMSVGSGPDGGVTVPTIIDTQMVELLRDLSPMRTVAQVIQIGSPNFSKVVNKKGTSSGWRSETDAPTETDTPSLGVVQPPIGEIYAYPTVSQHLLDDSQFDVGAMLMNEITEEVAFQEGVAFISGNGTNKPKGFLAGTTPAATADDVRAFGTLQYVVSGQATALPADIDPFITLLYSLRPSYRQGEGVGWMMNSTTVSLLRKYKDSNGQYLWQPSTQAGQPSSFLGYPVYEMEAMPSVAAGAFPVAFGNWRRGYLVVDRIGTSVLRDPYTSKGFVKFYVTKRVGGTVQNSQAIKLLKIAAS